MLYFKIPAHKLHKYLAYPVEPGSRIFSCRQCLSLLSLTLSARATTCPQAAISLAGPGYRERTPHSPSNVPRGEGPESRSYKRRPPRAGRPEHHQLPNRVHQLQNQVFISIYQQPRSTNSQCRSSHGNTSLRTA